LMKKKAPVSWFRRGFFFLRRIIKKSKKLFIFIV